MAMKKKLVSLVAAVALYSINVSSTLAATVTIDFDNYPSGLSVGDLGTTVLTLPEATFTSADSNLLIGISYTGSRGICATRPIIMGGDCETDMRVDFTNPVNGLIFGAWVQNVGDEITVDVFGSSGLLGSIIPTITPPASSTTVDLTGFSNVTSINIRYTGADGNGYLYDDFTFTPVLTPPPTPTAFRPMSWLPLLLE